MGVFLHLRGYLRPSSVIEGLWYLDVSSWSFNKDCFIRGHAIATLVDVELPSVSRNGGIILVESHLRERALLSWSQKRMFGDVSSYLGHPLDFEWGPICFRNAIIKLFH